MPHVIVKMLAGRSEPQKAALADAVARAVMAGAGVGEDAVSVSIEEFAPQDWTAKVYEPDILGGAGALYRKPGYKPLPGR